VQVEDLNSFLHPDRESWESPLPEEYVMEEMSRRREQQEEEEGSDHKGGDDGEEEAEAAQVDHLRRRRIPMTPAMLMAALE
jgi:hypothetical protein